MQSLKRHATCIALAVAATAGMAQEFPEGSTTPTAAELRQLIGGKVFSVKTATNTWRLQIKDDGYFFLNIGNFADSGTWTSEDGKWCSKSQKGNLGCNEMRVSSGSLFMKRDNGEIVRLTPQ